MSHYESLSQEELVAELNRLMSERVERQDRIEPRPTWALNEVALLQIELEMQNRELQRSQQATEEVKNRYRRLYDFAPVGYCSLDREGSIIELNLTASNMLRAERMFCIGARFEELCPPLKADAFRTHFAACRARGALVASDIWVAIEQRGWVPLEFRTEPEIVGGHLVGFNSIITERQREEDARRLLDDVRRALMNTSPHRANLQSIAELVTTHLADLCIIESLDLLGDLSVLGAHGNADALKVVQAGRGCSWRSVAFGAPNVARTGEPEMQTFRNSVVEPSVALDSAYCPYLRQTGASSYMCVPLRAKTTLLGVMTLVMGETGRGYDDRDLHLAMEIASSIAWVLENTRQLAETQRQIQLRQDLLALVAHDLRTPLNALRVASELEASGATSPQHREIGRRSVDTMARMIEDLLDFSAVEAGRLSIHRETHDLLALLNAAADMLRPAVAAKGLELIVECTEADTFVLCDRHRIVQVLTNLGENAIKATETGAIRFSGALVGGEVQVSVQDSGRGIPQEILPHVFDRYWRPRRDKRSAGRGLGLFIVRGIVEGHDGRIWVESEPGRGTRFTFTLPEARIDEELTNVAANHPLRVKRDRSILIIEDDAESRSLLRDLLLRRNFWVHTAGNGREALDLTRLVKPSLILLDLSMPMMDGAQFVRIAQNDDALRGIPIILVSGDADLRVTARELQVAGYAPKPIQVDSLMTTIDTALACGHGGSHGHHA